MDDDLSDESRILAEEKEEEEINNSLHEAFGDPDSGSEYDASKDDSPDSSDMEIDERQKKRKKSSRKMLPAAKRGIQKKTTPVYHKSNLGTPCPGTSTGEVVNCNEGDVTRLPSEEISTLNSFFLNETSL